MRTDYQTVKYGGINVYWKPELDGGGTRFGQDYLPLISRLFGKVGRLCEVCAGPGFIGFSLLAHGLCESLVLVDVNPDAISAVHETIRANGLEDRVTAYESDCLDSVPAHEKWDLVVANPPHFSTPLGVGNPLLTDDVGWSFHNRFFQQISAYLHPSGSILLQKNTEGSEPATMTAMIDPRRLAHVNTVWYVPNGFATIFYLWLKLAGHGLVFDQGPAEICRVTLTDPAQETTLSGGASRATQLMLMNNTPGLVKIWLEDQDGGEPLGSVAKQFLPLEIEPGRELVLPSMALRENKYVVTDGSGRPLAYINITS